MNTSTPIAKCYLANNNDDQNVCQVYTDYIIIVHKGKSMLFDRMEIVDINVKHKKLLFPIIFGGIVGTFFMIAAFNFSINIWLSLGLSFLGIIGFLYGWYGKSTFSIITPVKEYDYFLNTIYAPLITFTQFIKAYIIANKEATIHFYLPFTKDQWKLQEMGDTLLFDNKTYLYTLKELELNNITSFLKIDVSKVEIPILIDSNNSNSTIAPYIVDRINKSALELINLN